MVAACGLRLDVHSCNQKYYIQLRGLDTPSTTVPGETLDLKLTGRGFDPVKLRMGDGAQLFGTFRRRACPVSSLPLPAVELAYAALESNRAVCRASATNPLRGWVG